jgi:flagella basal body P-ring formation protein FlgA
MAAVTLLCQEMRIARVPRRAVVWLFAAAIAAAATLATVLVFRAVSARPAVVALAVSLQQGQRITAADLRLASAGAAGAVPAAELSGVVGQYAITQLTAGTVLTRADLSAAPIPVPGDALVWAKIPGAGRLVPGDRLTVTSAGHRLTNAVVFAVRGKSVELLVPRPPSL